MTTASKPVPQELPKMGTRIQNAAAAVLRRAIETGDQAAMQAAFARDFMRPQSVPVEGLFTAAVTIPTSQRAP
jgi:hypothetical protein